MMKSASTARRVLNGAVEIVVWVNASALVPDSNRILAGLIMWWGRNKVAAERAALPGEILAAIEAWRCIPATVTKTTRAS
ncbi:Uncharacterised protein [Escherichia coli]|nr:Uncharacterised protein [Escherichia coli]